MSRIQKGIFCIISLLLAVSSEARPFEAKAMGGVNVSRLSNNRSVAVSFPVTNDYLTDETTQTGPLVGLGFARGFDLESYRITVGASGYYLNLEYVSGLELPWINSGSYDTLNYHFHTSAGMLMFESRFIYTATAWQPYATVGIGPSWNRLYGYTEKPTNPSGSAAPVPIGFANNTMPSFAYQAGVGVQHQLFQRPNNRFEYLLAAEYRYIHMGRGELGPLPTQNTSDRIEVSPINTQAFILTFTTLF